MSEPEIVFALAAGQNAFFVELAEALAFELRRAGGRARVADDELPEPAADRVHVLLPPHEFVALTGFSPPRRTLARCVLISAEPPQMHHFQQNLGLARHAGAVLDINPRAVRALRAAGVKAEHLRLGYTERWDRPARCGEVERDIDILFMGRHTDRRASLLASYANVFERFRTRIVLSDNSRPNSSTSSTFVSGEEKLELLSRSRVLVNVHGEDEPYFEWLRVVEAICCGCVVVSEHATDSDPLVPYEHFVTGAPERLGVLAAWMADEEGERAHMAWAARELLASQVRLADAAETLRTCAAKASGAKVTAPPGRVTRLQRERMRRRPEPEPRQPLEIEHPLAAAVILRAAKSQYLQLLTLRRQIAAGQLAAGRPEDPVPRVRRLAVTDGWGRATQAALTVCVPLFNQVDTLLEALDSLLVSTRRDWELVLVDDASTDGSTSLAEEWLELNDDRRAVIVRHEVNRGLPHARNTAARYARTNRLLMLDSDNLLRRRAMVGLMGALDADPAASFAYSILDRFSERGSEGLLSWLGWEPDRFRTSNYIDALALIRRDVLMDLGGYSTDSRLFGWEDYDLWVRMAEAGHHGAFVPQMLARYRVSPASMVSLTNLSPHEAYGALLEHAPNLLHGIRIPG